MSDSIAPISKRDVDEENAAETDAIDFDEIRFRLLRRVTEAVETALARLHAAAQGQPTFQSDVDFRAARALIDLLPLLISERSVGDFERHQNQDVFHGIPLIPRCPICNEGPGAHWPEYCPQRDKPAKPPMV